jgi:hypothetical protein
MEAFRFLSVDFGAIFGAGFADLLGILSTALRKTQTTSSRNFSSHWHKLDGTFSLPLWTRTMWWGLHTPLLQLGLLTNSETFRSLQNQPVGGVRVQFTLIEGWMWLFFEDLDGRQHGDSAVWLVMDDRDGRHGTPRESSPLNVDLKCQELIKMTSEDRLQVHTTRSSRQKALASEF